MTRSLWLVALVAALRRPRWPTSGTTPPRPTRSVTGARRTAGGDAPGHDAAHGRRELAPPPRSRRCPHRQRRHHRARERRSTLPAQCAEYTQVAGPDLVCPPVGPAAWLFQVTPTNATYGSPPSTWLGACADGSFGGDRRGRLRARRLQPAAAGLASTWTRTRRARAGLTRRAPTPSFVDSFYAAGATCDGEGGAVRRWALHAHRDRHASGRAPPLRDRVMSRHGHAGRHPALRQPWPWRSRAHPPAPPPPPPGRPRRNPRRLLSASSSRSPRAASTRPLPRGAPRCRTRSRSATTGPGRRASSRLPPTPRPLAWTRRPAPSLPAAARRSRSTRARWAGCRPRQLPVPPEDGRRAMPGPAARLMGFLQSAYEPTQPILLGGDTSPGAAPSSWGRPAARPRVSRRARGEDVWCQITADASAAPATTRSLLRAGVSPDASCSAAHGTLLVRAPTWSRSRRSVPFRLTVPEDVAPDAPVDLSVSARASPFEKTARLRSRSGQPLRGGLGGRRRRGRGRRDASVLRPRRPAASWSSAWARAGRPARGRRASSSRRDAS